ncbi:hypothetical protein HMPREF3222_00321 [Clostridium perfringens]|uniref:Uncharacterized protein n=1 Tax=Clostridium perfringens TaxID=1502 RepID=A0A133NDS8_CLOPF|nr:hypothetical protein HMPREF3222_00321 [Clostridium perfringens]
MLFSSFKLLLWITFHIVIMLHFMEYYSSYGEDMNKFLVMSTKEKLNIG